MNTSSRLPRSLHPLPGESLAGYLLNLAYRLNLTPGDVACRTGLLTHEGYTSLNLQFAIALPTDRQETFAEATGLSPQAVVELTHARYTGRWHSEDELAPLRTAKSHYGTRWATPSWGHFCPQCLTQGRSDNPDRRLWRLQWTTPWAVACVEHSLLLVRGCPASQSHARLKRDPQEYSLIRAPRHPVAHPAACRLPVPRLPEHPLDRVPLCGQRLDTSVAEVAPQAIIALQRRLDGIMDGHDLALTTLGLPVDSIQYLRDLRLMAVLLQIADQPEVFPGLPPGYLDATARYLQERSEYRNGSPTHHRTWAYPPSDPHVLATLLVTADALLSRDDPQREIRSLAEQALRNERARWTKLRWHGQPSDRLAPLLTAERTGLISTPNLRRASGGERYTLTADDIPAFLDRATCERAFGDFPQMNELRDLRRTVPLGLVRLIEKCRAEEAATALGYPAKTAGSTTYRVASHLGREGARRLQDRIAQHAKELDQQSERTNWGHRRRHFTADWLVPDEEWETLTRLVSKNRITNKQSVLEDRRRTYSAWIWSIVTSGDPVLAPMVEPPEERAKAPGRGVVQTLRNMTRRGHLSTPLHYAIVEDVAASIAAQIDSTFASPASNGKEPAEALAMHRVYN